MWTKLFDRMVGSFLHRGTLIIQLVDGTVLRYGDGQPPEVRVAFHDEDLPRRLLFSPEIVMGEGYMDGTITVENDDLHGLLQVLLGNFPEGAGTWPGLLRMFRKIATPILQFNPTGKARRNVAHHYDLSGEMYELFLDTDKQYSCAYFRTPEVTLEEAQAAKKAHIAGKLLLEPGMKVLDIGCGWGGMALTLARDYGVQVLGVTLSTEQHKVATERAAAAGLSDRVEFRLTDYRNVRETFDRIVSVGMFEHVGAPHYREYFRHMKKLLNPDGVALIHTIGRFSPPGSTSPWITKYIFPGGYCPALSETMAAVEREGLVETDVEIWRLHYAETLRHWQMRFEANIDKVRALYDDRFCRMWRFYLVASEMSFRYGGQCVFQIQLARRQEAVPLTRDYLYVPEARAALRAAE
ncbi:class I SAM-dependent methyltransferase [Ruixingdingia sedimenti]